MKITKYFFALFIFSTLFTSCINDDASEEDALYKIQATGGEGSGEIDDEKDG